MISRKLALALSLTAAFGMLACDDSSSSPSNDTPDPSQVKVDCNVSTSGNSVTVKYGVESVGEMITTTFELDGDKIIETFVEDYTTSTLSAAIVDEACDKAKKENKDAEITCSGKKITVVTTEDAEGQTLDDLKEMGDGMCEAIKGNVNIDPEEDDDPDEEGPGEEGPGKDGPGEDGPGKDGPGEDGPGKDGPGEAGPGEDMMKCDRDGETKEVGVGDFKTTMICKDGNWAVDSSSADQYACDEEGATKDMDMGGLTMKMVCEDGAWTPSEDAMDDLLKCDEEGATKDLDMGGLTMKMVCVEGEWTVDQQSADEMFACSAAEEGQKKEMDIYGMVMPMVCQDGEWTPDMQIEEVSSEE